MNYTVCLYIKELVMTFRFTLATVILFCMIFIPLLTRADVPLTDNGVTTIHFDEYKIVIFLRGKH